MTPASLSDLLSRVVHRDPGFWHNAAIAFEKGHEIRVDYFPPSSQWVPNKGEPGGKWERTGLTPEECWIFHGSPFDVEQFKAHAGEVSVALGVASEATAWTHWLDILNKYSLESPIEAIHWRGGDEEERPIETTQLLTIEKAREVSAQLCGLIEVKCREESLARALEPASLSPDEILQPPPTARPELQFPSQAERDVHDSRPGEEVVLGTEDDATTPTPALTAEAREARKRRRRRMIRDHQDRHDLDRVAFLAAWGFSNTTLYGIVNDTPGRFSEKSRRTLLQMLSVSDEEWDRL
jgi:hypothetical protein